MSQRTSTTTIDASKDMWILGPTWDLLLFVCTPLLIIPGMYIARSQWSIESIALFVASFGALGHHLPGMIRAYGDRALFRRFRHRFIWAPIFLATICVVYSLYDLSGILLAVYLWGVWHGLMQTYGFLRIYDAKAKSFMQLTSRLDWLMCVAWFLGGIVLSDMRTANLLATFYKAGGFLISAPVIAAIKTFVLVLLVGVTFAFLAHTAILWRRGTPPSPVKLLLMITSFGFWWYSNLLTGNLLVGIALFEIFHDVQYLSIVWMVNRRRTASSEKGDLSGLVRFLFRRSGSLAGLYVGLVFAYGSLNYVAQGSIEMATVQRALTGLLLASALLHFYYDGFIWKVREASTQKSLGLEGGSVGATGAMKPPGWLLHGLRWSLFVIPVLALGIMEAKGSVPSIERTREIAKALPDFAQAQYNLGVELASLGEMEAARAQYERSLELNPDLADAHYNLANMAFGQDRVKDAISHYREAIRGHRLQDETGDSSHRLDALTLHGNLGNALLANGELDAAVVEYRQALALGLDSAESHGNLANALALAGAADEALEHYREAVRLEPASAQVWFNLGRFLSDSGAEEAALAAYRRAVQNNPDFADAHFNLANGLARQGLHGEAIQHFRQALRVAPSADFLFNLGNSLLVLGRLDEAAGAFQAALELEPAFPQAHHNLGIVAHQVGKTAQAMARFLEAVRLDPDYADAHQNLGLLLQQQGDHVAAGRHLATAQRLRTGSS